MLIVTAESFERSLYQTIDTDHFGDEAQFHNRLVLIGCVRIHAVCYDDEPCVMLTNSNTQAKTHGRF